MVIFQEKYLTVAETAARWGVQVRVVQEWCRTGRIPDATRVGRNWRIPADSERPEDRRLRRLCQTGHGVQTTCSMLSPCSTLNTLGMDDASLLGQVPEGDHRQLLLINLAKLRGNHAEALALARTIPETSPHYVGALFWRYRASAVLGEIAGAQAAYRQLQELRESRVLDCVNKAQATLALLIIDTTLYSYKSLPPWFIRGNFTRLPVQDRPLALYANIRYLHGLGQFERMLGCAQTALAFLQGSGSSIEIYLVLMVTAALVSLNRIREAENMVEQAARRAIPRNILGPFAECMGIAGGVVERVFLRNWPQLVSGLNRMQASVWQGWVQTHNALLHSRLTTELNRAEWHVAFLVARGFSNREIAIRLGMSPGMVKRRVQTILLKLGEHKRRDIAPHVRWRTG